MDSSSFVSFLPLFFIMLLISSSATACDRCLHNSKVGYFGRDYAIPRGTCGYGSQATSFSNGMVAGAAPSIYKNGTGCGSCFLISCKNATLCSKQGTKVIVTDLNNADNLDFVLTRKAFVAMANVGMGRHILNLGLVDVQYRRIPCGFQNKNLTVHVDESSHSPSYLSIEFIYQGNWKPGFNYDLGVQITNVMQEECSLCDEEQI